MIFQSHFGLILSILCKASQVVQEWTFNPILVWFYHTIIEILIHKPQLLSIPFWSDFISYSGSDRHESKGDFQSHFGLILSRFDVTLEFHWKGFQSHFGLILSNIYTQPLGSNRPDFQSHFGLILSKRSKEIFLLPHHFFQSHFGLILSSYPYSQYISLTSFQSHFGLILSTPVLDTIMASLSISFQSHFGLILSLLCSELLCIY